MHDPNHEAPDALADILRAAGPRALPPDEHYDQVYAAAHRAWQRQLSRRRSKRWLAAAASLGLLAVTSALYQFSGDNDATAAATVVLARNAIEVSVDDGVSWQAAGHSSALESGARLRTREQGAVALALTDGGSLRLADNTEIVLGRSRFELVDGTLYFDSAGRPAGAAIEISTVFGTLHDIGTQFEARKTDGALRLRIRTGRVTITRPSNALDYAAQSGRQIEVTPTGTVVERPFAADDPAWGWAEALAAPPEAESILRYLNWIARETGKQLRWSSRYVELKAETETLVGDPAGLTPMQLLNLIATTTDFRYEDLGDGTLAIQRIDER